MGAGSRGGKQRSFTRREVQSPLPPGPAPRQGGREGPRAKGWGRRRGLETERPYPEPGLSQRDRRRGRRGFISPEGSTYRRAGAVHRPQHGNAAARAGRGEDAERQRATKAPRQDARRELGGERSRSWRRRGAGGLGAGRGSGKEPEMEKHSRRPRPDGRGAGQAQAHPERNGRTCRKILRT